MTNKKAVRTLHRAFRHVQVTARRAATGLGVEQQDLDAMKILVLAEMELLKEMAR